MKILYLGGTGQISFDCVHASVRAGHDVHVFNRGNHNDELPPPPEVTYHVGDYDVEADVAALADHHFDAVCSFRTFTVEPLRRDVRLFTGKVGRYVFISSASAYHKPVYDPPVTEATPLHNPFWEYSQHKIACEKLLTSQDALPFVIVRPSHTMRYGLVNPIGDGGLLAHRLRAGKPIVVPGDGTSLWTLTAAADFAPPFVKLVAADAALGEAFHLTTDRAQPWSAILAATAAALGAPEPDFVGVPTDTLVRHRPDWRGPLWGDKSWSLTFDNTKIKSVVGDFDCPTSLEQHAAQLVEGHRRHEPTGPTYDVETDRLLDQLVSAQRALAIDA
jgi:nucleoside-diphosphate-sugar epimerase